jgi:hypothetical protein
MVSPGASLSERRDEMRAAVRVTPAVARQPIPSEARQQMTDMPGGLSMSPARRCNRFVVVTDQDGKTAAAQFHHRLRRRLLRNSCAAARS